MIVLVVWTVLFLALGMGGWELLGGELMLIVFLALSWTVYTGYAFLSRCPSCRTPVLLRPVKLFGVEVFLWSLLTPRRCRHCGEPLP
jgi:hypothetical protein